MISHANLQQELAVLVFQTVIAMFPFIMTCKLTCMQGEAEFGIQQQPVSETELVQDTGTQIRGPTVEGHVPTEARTEEGDEVVFTIRVCAAKDIGHVEEDLFVEDHVVGGVGRGILGNDIAAPEAVEFRA